MEVPLFLKLILFVNLYLYSSKYQRYMKWITVVVISVLICLSCTKEGKSTKLFEKLDGSQTGIEFSNILTENDSLNYFTYSYLYMGGGIAAGDINNDGLTDLYFSGNMVPNKLYLNKGNLQFEDITEQAGIAGDERWYTGVTMADVNNDGLLDIYCSVGGKFSPKENQLFINQGDLTFEEEAEKYGLDDSGNSVQATFFDYDRDGDLDMYLANYPPTPFNAPNQYYLFKTRYPKEIETDRLFQNNDGEFTNVAKEAGLRSFGLTLSATVGDLNADGWPDIYVSNDFSSPDYLFINNQDGTFTEQVKQLTKNTSFYGMGTDIADFNNDSWLDILQVDMTAQDNRRSKANMASMNPDLFWSTVNSGFHYQYMQNSLQLNNGLLQDTLPDFSNISRLAGISSTDWSWGPLIADLDNDGWKDIFISNGTRREINNRDYFLQREADNNPMDSLLERSQAIPSERIDNFVYRNEKDLTFKEVNTEWGLSFEGFSNGAVYADLDNDGDLEIVINNIDDPAYIFENKASESANYLSFLFDGPPSNRDGLGVKVWLKHKDEEQFQELTLSRGFQSSVPPVMHFGIGDNKQIDSVVVQWPDDKQQYLKNVTANQHITFDYSVAETWTHVEKDKKDQLFVTVSDSTLIIPHLHQENFYNDFEKEILLPHQTSTFGPNIAVGDLNGDTLDDLIIGGASGFPASIYFQTAAGFISNTIEAFEEDLEYEDLGIEIFDANGDGLNDIYVVSGGNEFSADSELLQDRLYISTGNGNFIRSLDGLPQIRTSGSRVHSNDFDKDGDLDLLVCGRLVPGNYPAPANSYLLENTSQNGKTSFIDITDSKAPMLRELGLATDASWTDIDNDGNTDLIIVGEWMPITILKNSGTTFQDVSAQFLDSDTSGWWFSIVEGDFDQDGDQDFIVGNLGLNYKYKANDEETFDIYFNDFDNSGTNDIVLSYFNGGKKYPLRGRECSSQQMPGIKKKFEDYASFSTATLEDVYTTDYLESSLHYQVRSFASVYLENKGNRLVAVDLPNLAQLSSVNKILKGDFDKDGHLDAVLAGNLYGSEVETPRNDASIGVFLKGDGNGNFEAVPNRISGLFAPGDVKDMSFIRIEGNTFIVFAKNSDYLQLVQINTDHHSKDDLIAQWHR